MKKDRNDNLIGDGSWHVKHHILDLGEYPQVHYKVQKSNTSESVYVKYFNAENGKQITARFSLHENNAVRFGEQLNGYTAERDEVLYYLGLKEREFIPNTFLAIAKRMVKKIEMKNYKESELTIQEIYALGAGADISEHTGKLAKGSNWLIEGDKITEMEESRINDLGQEVIIGKYIYK